MVVKNGVDPKLFGKKGIRPQNWGQKVNIGAKSRFRVQALQMGCFGAWKGLQPAVHSLVVANLDPVVVYGFFLDKKGTVLLFWFPATWADVCLEVANQTVLYRVLLVPFFATSKVALSTDTTS